MSVLIAFAFLSAITLGVVSSTGCPAGWIDTGDNCYKLENSLSLSWIKAQQHCQELGGHLAEPISEDTSNLLTSIASIETDVLGVPAWWLGLSDLAHEGRWIWQHSLDDVGYTNWAPDSPIVNDVERNCVRMVAESDLMWVDESCTGTVASPICQVETSQDTTSTLPPTTVTSVASSTDEEVQVLLVGGDGSTTGNVYALNSQGYFGPVCDDGWGAHEATVVCRQLGWTDGNPTYSSEFGQVPEDFAMDDVVCSGSEDALQDCGYDEEDNCRYNEGAGVVCFY